MICFLISCAVLQNRTPNSMTGNTYVLKAEDRLHAGIQQANEPVRGRLQQLEKPWEVTNYMNTKY